ncbi:PfkB family carbohydrate kinase [Alsobacter sp. SYSU M60028]|uniref:PfkB family carbohydrate kinase n=1 Tax=Alsobacter ponti TaxID=2962936 RepID=A0ABT1L878_9HYPH|nr:PfkB family carbohydrate kinase [Alsobacter ponti]MCP8937710.1 PfkB family carbohydrate kinase [Alsobacter ponti]
MTGVLCVGIATQDFVFGMDAMPSRAEKHRARDLAAVGGGIAANAAVAVARLGGRAMLASRLGDDSVGDGIVKALEADGVDCSLTLRATGVRSSLSAVLVDSAGERMVINYADPATPDDAGHMPARLPEGVRAVMADTRWETGALAAFRAARASGGFGVLDADRAVQSPELSPLATHVAYAAQAVREMTGEEDARRGLARLAATASNWIAVTDGARGVFFTENGAVAQEPAFRIAPVDTLGAGDVFHGALALGLAEGMGERAAVRFASAAAAIKCTRFGGRAGCPTRRELEDFLRQAAQYERETP